MNRSPKPMYYEGGWIHFTRDGQQITFHVMRWNNEQTSLGEIKKGSYTGQSKEEMLNLG